MKSKNQENIEFVVPDEKFMKPLLSVVENKKEIVSLFNSKKFELPDLIIRQGIVDKFQKIGTEISNNKNYINAISIVNSYDFAKLNLEMQQTMQDTLKQFSNNAALLEKNISESLIVINKILKESAFCLQQPFIEWSQQYDFSSLCFPEIEDINVDSSVVDEFNNKFPIIMYECKWCPFAFYYANNSLFFDLIEILKTSRGKSQRREKRIDKIVLSYYSQEIIKEIKKNWRSAELEPFVKRILSQSLNAHLRGEYALTISSLATMWEGLIDLKFNNILMSKRSRQNTSKTKNALKQLVDNNNYSEIFYDYYDNFIVSQCEKVEDVIEGVPNRNGIAHSWYYKYPTAKASLNAILFTDFIINLTAFS